MQGTERCLSCDRTTESICLSEDFKICSNCQPNNIPLSFDKDTQLTVVLLSPEDLLTLEQALKHFHKDSMHKIISEKNAIIKRCLEEMRHAEEECAKRIKSMLNKHMEAKAVFVKGFAPVEGQATIAYSIGIMKTRDDLSINSILRLLNSSFSSSVNEELKLKIPVALPTLNECTWSLKKSFKAHSNKLMFYKKSWISSIAISLCGEFLATAGQDKTIKVWSIQQGEHLRTLKGHKDTINSLGFLGHQIISGSEDCTIKFWDGNDCVRTLEEHCEGVLDVCASHSENLLASCGKDNEIIVWDSKNFHHLYTLLGHEDSVSSVVFSSDDMKIASGSFDNTIKIWNIQGKLLSTLLGHHDRVTTVKFSGNFLLSGSRDAHIKIWEMDKYENICTFSENSAGISRIDFHNNMIAALCADNSIRIWDMETAEVRGRLDGHGTHEDTIVMGLTFSSCGQFLISGGGDGKLNIWTRSD